MSTWADPRQGNAVSTKESLIPTTQEQCCPFSCIDIAANTAELPSNLSRSRLERISPNSSSLNSPPPSLFGPPDHVIVNAHCTFPLLWSCGIVVHHFILVCACQWFVISNCASHGTGALGSFTSGKAHLAGTIALYSHHNHGKLHGPSNITSEVGNLAIHRVVRPTQDLPNSCCLASQQCKCTLLLGIQASCLWK